VIGRAGEEKVRAAWRKGDAVNLARVRLDLHLRLGRVVCSRIPAAGQLLTIPASSRLTS